MTITEEHEIRKRNISKEQPTEQSSKNIQTTNTSSPPSKYKKLMIRCIVGAIMISAAYTIIISPYATLLTCILVIITQTLSFREVTNIRYQSAKEKNLPWFRLFNWYSLFATFFFLYGEIFAEYFHNYIPQKVFSFLIRYHIGISYTLYIVGLCGFIISLKKGYYKYQFTQMAWTLMSLVFIVGQSHFVFKLIFEGLFWFVFPLSLIVCNDMMAYFSGFFFGRKWIDRPLISLSPNKTWEGFLGGFLFTVLWGWFFSGYLLQFNWMLCPQKSLDSDSCIPSWVFTKQQFELLGYTIMIQPIRIHALFLALFASFIAPFGGFFASGMKRAHQKKDFDNIFPGHGGVTDRMDCQLIMSFFTYVYFKVEFLS